MFKFNVIKGGNDNKNAYLYLYRGVSRKKDTLMDI
jgi:hypothetical protein